MIKSFTSTALALSGLLVLAGCPSELAAPGTCGGSVCEPPKPAEPPRLFVDPPFGLGYDCVTLGCDTERKLVVENRGGGTVRIVLSRLSVGTSTDFSLRRGDNSPLPVDDASAVDVLPGAPIELFVRYAPTDGTADSGAVVIDWYDGTKPYEDAVLTTAELPLSTRALGNVAAVSDVLRLNFGFVPVGGYATRDIEISNTGNGGVLAIGPVSLEDLTSPVFEPATATAWDEQFINPADSGTVSVTFRPDAVGTFVGALHVQTNDGAQPSIRIEVAGTAVGEPDAVVSTPLVDFQSIRSGTSRTLPLVVTNNGGAPLSLQAAIIAGLDLSLTPLEPLVVAPLESTTLQVTWAPLLGGDMNGTVQLSTNDPAEPTIDVSLRGFSNAPSITITPTPVDFGDVVQGWETGARSFTITNVGFGDLTISSIAFDPTRSSPQIRFVEVPPLPVKLTPGDTGITVSVAMDATTLGRVNATVIVGSDSIPGLSVEGLAPVLITGNVITCEQGCPVTNGTPSCSSGACAIDVCINRFHDADQSFGSGCECGEDLVPAGGGTRRDVGGTCDTSVNIGPIGDNCADVQEVRRTGTLHDESDVDLYVFHATDESRFFGCDFTGDSWGVLARLEGAPADMRVCAQRSGNGCGGVDSRTCGTTEVRFAGGNDPFGGSDTSDITVWVEWAPGSFPQCGQYTLFAKGNTG